MDILNIIVIMGRIIVETFKSPLILLFAAIFFLICWQYRRLYRPFTATHPNCRYSYLLSALVSSGAGLAGGCIGSILLVFIGIDLKSIGIIQLWLLALLLMFINPRLVCFAYAGGILSLWAIITGNQWLSVPHLTGLVATLHLVESILILLDGRFNPLPVYIKVGDKVRGGFHLQKFWPLPLLAIFGSDISSGLNMPQWWPLIKWHTGMEAGGGLVLLPVLALLGFGETTTTSTPGKRVKKSSFNLFIYSLLLLVLSIIASLRPQFQIAAALFAPLGHELIIWMGMWAERSKPPLYTNPPQGVMVLAVIPRTPAQKGGIKVGDIILRVDGQHVHSYQDIGLFSTGISPHRLEILRARRNITREITVLPGQEWGIIPVPKTNGPYHIMIKDSDSLKILGALWKKIKNAVV